ncbi:hypothetical protein D3Z60_21940 [Lachnospiraceae bacterium]|jgi:hypothetical protein|nr:hypothetical protein [Lachnospiraceae bacterium]
MEIGNLQAFKEQQMGKVKMRAEEKKKIQKGVNQMQAMIDAQNMGTLMKECDTVGRPSDAEKTERKGTQSESRDGRKTDPQTEMEKMLSTASKGLDLISKTV